MWFIGCSALVGLLFLLCWLLGGALLQALGIRGSTWKSEVVALDCLLGAAVLVLTSGWLSWLGLPMRGWGPILTATLVLLAGLALARSRLRAPSANHFRLPDGRLLSLLGLAVITGFLGLLPLLQENAINPYNDTIPSISLGEYLQDHSFRTPVPLSVQSPITATTALYQHAGLRMGAHFLLALVQSWSPTARSIDVFPAVSVFGLLLLLMAVYLCCRWLIGSPPYQALCACLFGFTNLSLAHYSVDWGYMNQLYGIAFAFSGMALASRLYGAADDAAFRWILTLGVLSAALLCAYSELVPIYGMILLVGAAWRAIFSRGWGRRRFSRLLSAGLIAAVLCNIELPRAVKNITVQMKPTETGTVGSHIDYSALEFFGSWLGVYPGPNDRQFYHDFAAGGPLALLLPALGALALLLWVFGFGAMIWKGRIRFRPEITAAHLVFGALFLYFAFAVKNPFIPGRIGQTWNLSKLTMYSFPLGICMLAHALRILPRTRATSLVFVFATALLFLPVHGVLSRRQTENVRNLTRGHDRPFGAFEQFAKRVQREANGAPVQIKIPLKSPCFHYELAAYYLYPAPVASAEWRNMRCDSLRCFPGCYYLGFYENMAFVSPSGPYALTLLPDDAPVTEGESLPAGFIMRRKPTEIDLSYARGWTPWQIAGQEDWWYLSGGSSDILVRSRGDITIGIRGTLQCASPDRPVAITLDGMTLFDNGCGPFGFAREGVRLSPGEHLIRFESARGAPQSSQARFYLGNLRLDAGSGPATPP